MELIFNEASGGSSMSADFWFGAALGSIAGMGMTTLAVHVIWRTILGTLRMFAQDEPEAMHKEARR